VTTRIELLVAAAFVVLVLVGFAMPMKWSFDREAAAFAECSKACGSIANVEVGEPRTCKCRVQPVKECK
jgi:hypothetical protein